MSVPQPRLYIVSISVETVVYAESEIAAERLAIDNLGDIMIDGQGPDTDARPVEFVDGQPILPDGWEPDCIPYYKGQGGKTIYDLIEEIEARPKPCTHTADMFEAKK